MGSLRHGKMEQAGARNGLKQTRISSREPLKQKEPTYGSKEFSAEELHDKLNAYDASRSSQLSNMTSEQLENLKLNDTNVVHTDFNLNKFNLDPSDNTGTSTSKGLGLYSPVISENSASESTYTVTNPKDPSLNRTESESPPVIDVPLMDFRVNENNKNRKGRGRSTVTEVETYYKPTNGGNNQQISQTEYNQAVRNYQEFDEERKAIQGGD